MESTGVYWRPVWNILEGHFRLLLANPAQVKALLGRKSDRRDARRLAEFLEDGRLDPSFVPPREIRTLRQLTRDRVGLVEEQTRLHNQIRDLLETANIKLGNVASDILGETGRRILAALASGQDDLGIVLIQKRNALEASVKTLDQEMEQARADAQEAKDSLMQVKGEIQKLKDEKDRMLAQMQSAQARLKIQNQLDGLSVDAEVRALDNVREHIRNTVAEAKMGSELRDSDLDVKLARLRQSSGAITARQQLEEMKRARLAQSESTGKSM